MVALIAVDTWNSNNHRSLTHFRRFTHLLFVNGVMEVFCLLLSTAAFYMKKQLKKKKYSIFFWKCQKTEIILTQSFKVWLLKLHWLLYLKLPSFLWCMNLCPLSPTPSLSSVSSFTAWRFIAKIVEDWKW